MRDGLQKYCKDCSREYQRQYNVRHAEYLKLKRMERLARPVDLTTEKQCRKCGEVKPLLEFYAHRGTKDRRANYCRTCSQEIAREWRRNNAEKVRAQNRARTADPAARRRYLMLQKAWRLRLYGLTPERFEDLLDKQESCCAICGAVPADAETEGSTGLAVDHDHETGEVRGLLCRRCNLALGYFQDDVALMAKAIAYLVNPPARERADCLDLFEEA